MQRYFGLAKRFVLLATPAIATLLAAIPARAATFASSEAQFQINNFSINPEEVFNDSLNFAKAVNFNGQGEATANANSNAEFSTTADSSSEKPQASNISESITTGQGLNYAAIAESFAINSGFNFLVPKGGTFSFDFNAFLKLATSIDNPGAENATADGTIELAIYNESDDILLDSILVKSQIATPEGGDSLTFTNSGNLSLTNVSLTNSFGGNEEFAQANLIGRYSRTFAEETSLSLVEFKSNSVTVTAKVPENSNGFILIIVAGIMLVFRKIECNLILISTKEAK